eukprot:m.58182 g.58182  ORF g.58182 m.58182 type:complete len:53 (-) comp11247_c0_seq1:1581-1739(-)
MKTTSKNLHAIEKVKASVFGDNIFVNTTLVFYSLTVHISFPFGFFFTLCRVC